MLHATFLSVHCRRYKRKQPERGQRGGQWLTVERGRVLVSIDIVPKAQALAEPVGAGRAEPNRNPYLPKPSGRMRLTMNPFDMCYQVLGRKLLGKVLCFFLIFAIVSIAYYIVPSYMGDMIYHGR